MSISYIVYFDGEYVGTFLESKSASVPLLEEKAVRTVVSKKNLPLPLLGRCTICNRSIAFSRVRT